MGKLIAPLLLFLLVIIIFRAWFLPGTISAFDFPYFSKLMMGEGSFMQYAWGYHPGLAGFARYLSPYSWVLPLIYMPQVLFRDLGFDWSQISRIVYLFPILILSVFSPMLMFKKLFPENKFYLFSVFVYSFNTFALLLFSGQVYLSISYVLFPLIFYLFIDILSNAIRVLFKSILLGILLAFSMMADPRMTYIGILILFLFFIYSLIYFNNHKKTKKIINLFFFSTIIPSIIIFLLQAFWVIPSFLYGLNPVESLGNAYSSTDAVNFFSFAKLENSISLLHPNWPENIFGMVGFMKPEFLLLPILAFSSLLFINKNTTEQTKKTIVFFSIIGLVGAFLGKGSNPPFGSIYLWLFDNLPGFVMFRDASKWYMLVAVSYSVLIPLTLSEVVKLLKFKKQFSIFNFQFSFKSKYFNLQNIFVFLIISYLLFLIRPALFGEIGGTLKFTQIPQDYTRLEKFISKEEDFYRTLWYPSTQRFAYYSNIHPKLSASAFFNKYSYPEILEYLRTNEDLLSQSSVKYIIIPYDSEGEIFLTDRKYDENKYKQAIADISKIPWLRRVECCGKVVVFETLTHKDHFYIEQNHHPAAEVSYKFIDPSKYKVMIRNAKIGDVLVFSESFDKLWEAENESIQYKETSTKYGGIFNSFTLPRDGSYELTVYYKPQDWVNIGSLVSGISFISLIMVLLYSFLRKR